MRDTVHDLRKNNPGLPAKLKMEENLDIVKRRFEKKTQAIL